MMKLISKNGHWVLLIVACISFLKDLVLVPHTSIKVLSGLLFLTVLFVVFVLEKKKRNMNKL
ncbi:hypothetical protein [Bacillus pseudomycoides]|uniref:hypothetical protein n=1 Tax=Bacillus pseudomycoides TaxID=64104 RepID=UPI000BFAD1DF|nr:hypothetical protein [Bacillus pseudomycoides]PEI52378.1 hypothetical protein CN641_00305 [Bacillus pseudomycoides]PHE91998.1 hypothetical protein COF78_17900 [Bacillus pseudomycoides]